MRRLVVSRRRNSRVHTSVNAARMSACATLTAATGTTTATGTATATVFGMTSFHFRAVASDGQIRTGAIHGESERLVAYELRRQGLTPVYVGKEEKKPLDIKLPGFS